MPVSGTEAITANPTVLPVQNMGQLSHGASRAWLNQMLRYGFRTINGRTGGTKTEAQAVAASHTSTGSVGSRIVKNRTRRGA